MGSFWDKLKTWYNQGNSVIKLIFINAAVFVLIRLIYAILSLTGIDGNAMLDYLQLPSVLEDFILKPWTALTYMFVHFGFMHLLMNMFLLYFFGGLFISWFNSKQFLINYILGGLTGALVFVCGYYFIPGLRFSEPGAPLLGASASVMALCMAVTIYRPDYNLPLLLIGNVKLKYITIALIAFDILSMDKANIGVGLAHSGGILYGLIIGLLSKKGVDIFKNLFKSKPKMKVKYNRPKSEKANRTGNVDREYRERKKRESDRLDEILDKVKKSGYESLSGEEKKELFDFSNKGS